jgi:pyruvate/2-oxoglutarate dehydrogenase complex dihydrolipoamide acyltransferase (E2) component
MAFEIHPFPHSREVVIDGGYLATTRHIIHGFLELDVTDARGQLKATRGEDGHPLTFTAFLIATLAKAVKLHPAVHTYRDLRGRLVILHDVDVSTLVEPSPGAAAIPHVIRSADSRSVET